MAKQVYILKNRGKGNLDSIVSGDLFLMSKEETTKVYNSTQNEMTSAELNKIYPNALDLFQVICNQIGGSTGFVYQKIDSIWYLQELNIAL